MSHDFYPFVEADDDENPQDAAPKTSTPSMNAKDERDENHHLVVRYPARIAVYDDAAAAPRVVVIEPSGVRSYLEEITATVSRLAKEQGGTIPFMVIREVVENFIHAYFIEPTISILDGGETIRFSDQGPGIKSKDLALEYGTSSATEEMKQYIRGVGSGLPYVQQYMEDHGGTLTIDDNISGGTVVTISNVQDDGDEQGMAAYQQGYPQQAYPQQPAAAYQQPMQPMQPGYAQQPYAAQQMGQQMPQYPQYQYAPYGWQAYPQTGYQQMPAQQGMAPMPGVPAAPGVPAGQGAMALPTQAPAPLNLTERDRAVLSYLLVNASVGPTDLTRALGNSQPTWTRELQRLERAGFVRKNKGAQKYTLTNVGRSWAQQAGM